MLLYNIKAVFITMLLGILSLFGGSSGWTRNTSAAPTSLGYGEEVTDTDK